LRRGDPGFQAGEETPLPPFGVSRGILTQITASVFDMVKVVKRAYKYRFYPTPEQAADLSRTFGCVRKVWNLALQARTTAWDQRQERVTYVRSSAMLTQWKRSDDFAFLAEVCDSVVGIDAGITSLATLSTGEKIINPRHESRDRARLSLAQRRLARTQKGSANRDKARLKVARVHARIADRRKDFLHKLSTRIVRDNQAVVIEDLSVRNMVRNHHLARAISDAAWRQMRAMLEYKCEWYGRDLVVIGRWYPSSTTCSACGHHAGPLPLNIREWACVTCGTRHDRDINAAQNIRAAGLAVLACGAGVRPQRESSRAGGRR
jgi:putative transposase